MCSCDCCIRCSILTVKPTNHEEPTPKLLLYNCVVLVQFRLIRKPKYNISTVYDFNRRTSMFKFWPADFEKKFYISISPPTPLNYEEREPGDG